MDINKLKAFAEKLVEYSGGKLRLVAGEQDDSDDRDGEAATFLKLNDKRLGRDLEMYRFMSEVAGEGITLCNIYYKRY